MLRCVGARGRGWGAYAASQTTALYMKRPSLRISLFYDFFVSKDHLLVHLIHCRWHVVKNVLIFYINNYGYVSSLWSPQLFYFDNIFIRYGTKMYRQIVDIPMWINCAHIVAVNSREPSSFFFFFFFFFFLFFFSFFFFFNFFFAFVFIYYYCLQ